MFLLTNRLSSFSYSFFRVFFWGLESVCVLTIPTNYPLFRTLFSSFFWAWNRFVFLLTNQLSSFLYFFFKFFLGPESVCFLTFPSSYDKTSPSFQLTVRAHKCQLSPLSALHHLCHLNPLLYTKLFHFGICGFSFWTSIFELWYCPGLLYSEYMLRLYFSFTIFRAI